MTRDDVIRMAREAGGLLTPMHRNPIDHLERFAALVTADARAARIAAQLENEALKAKLAAASGVAERRAVREAVLAEREACAMVAESGFRFAHDGYQIADSIRARSAA